MVAILAAVVAAAILLSLAFGVSLSQLPWGAIILAVILAVAMLVVQRRRRREWQRLDDHSDDQPTD